MCLASLASGPAPSGEQQRAAHSVGLSGSGFPRAKASKVMKRKRGQNVAARSGASPVVTNGVEATRPRQGDAASRLESERTSDIPTSEPSFLEPTEKLSLSQARRQDGRGSAARLPNSALGPTSCASGGILQEEKALGSNWARLQAVSSLRLGTRCVIPASLKPNLRETLRAICSLAASCSCAFGRLMGRCWIIGRQA